MFSLLIKLFLFLGFLAVTTNAAFCGGHLTSPTGKIERPYQRDQVKYDLQCIWTITVPENHKIHLNTTKMALPWPKDGHCPRDWILIESLTAKKEIVSHGTFCGKDMPKIVSAENSLRIVYYHISSYDYDQEFYIVYEAVPLTVVELSELWLKYHIGQLFEAKENLPKAVSSLYMFDEAFFHSGNTTGTNITTQFYLQLAADLVRNLTIPLSAGDLSQHVNALLTVCSNPGSFYGVDLVDRLRKLVNKERGVVSPYYFLILCNAGAEMTVHDVMKLTAITRTYKNEMYWTDFQAIALMTLVCIDKTYKGFYLQTDIQGAAQMLISHQLPNGTFGSLQTTSLAIQALQAANFNESEWNYVAARRFIDRANNTDGSFGNLYDFYAVIPVITGKNLLYLNEARCDFTSDGLKPLREIKSNFTRIVDLVYSIWIGDRIDFSTTVTVRAPYGTSFLDFMRLAADKDERFQFHWIYVKHVSHVYRIFGIVNDPTSGKYWTLHTGTHARNVQSFKKGLEHYIPKDGDVAVLWYKTVGMEHSWPENDNATEKIPFYTDVNFNETSPDWKSSSPETVNITESPVYNDTSIFNGTETEHLMSIF